MDAVKGSFGSIVCAVAILSFTSENLDLMFWAVDVMPDNKTVVASNRSSQLYVNNNQGEGSWTNLGSTPIEAMGLLCDAQSAIYISNLWMDGIYRSTDLGANWQRIDIDVDGAFMNIGTPSQMMAEDNQGNIYVINGNYEYRVGIWKSPNGDPYSWRLVWDDFAGSEHAHGMFIEPVTQWIYAVTGEPVSHSQLIRSKDRGATWTPIIAKGEFPQDIHAPSPGVGARYRNGVVEVYFGTEHPAYGLFRLFDNGSAGSKPYTNVFSANIRPGTLMPTLDSRYVVWSGGNPDPVSDPSPAPPTTCAVRISRTGDTDTWQPILGTELSGYNRAHGKVAKHWTLDNYLVYGSGAAMDTASIRICYDAAVVSTPQSYIPLALLIMVSGTVLAYGLTR